jgi:DNA-binding NarL/FixJ family response regulator
VEDLSFDGRNEEAFSAAYILPLTPSTEITEFPAECSSEGSVKAVRSVQNVDRVLEAHIVVIDENALSRNCLMRCLSGGDTNFIAAGHASVEQWQQAGSRGAAPIVLLCATGRTATEIAVRQHLVLVNQAAPEARVIIVSDLVDSSEIVGALERGAKGYISTSSDLNIAIAAINLVRAGGTFVPASGLISSRSEESVGAAAQKDGRGSFTAKQLEVIKRLREGEPNKIIAYKLGMGECTVKVHVRNIMRKIKARNRTEVAFLTNGIF